tara:strand:- start:17211 stop:17489 length:279 start_codon:yes stop_codon:yes gene_type:complete
MKNLRIDCDINPPSHYGLDSGQASLCEFTVMVGKNSFRLDEWLNTDGTLEQVDSHIKINQSKTFAQVVSALGCTDEELWDALSASALDEVTV